MNTEVALVDGSLFVSLHVLRKSMKRMVQCKDILLGPVAGFFLFGLKKE